MNGTDEAPGGDQQPTQPAPSNEGPLRATNQVNERGTDERSGGDVAGHTKRTDHRNGGDILTGAVAPQSEDSEPSQATDHLGRSAIEPAPANVFRRRLEAWGPYQRWSWYRSSVALDHADRPYLRERDPKDNEEGRLNDDERVELPAVWVGELYTPSTVAGLLKGIGKLDWEHGRSRSDSLAKWMSDVRNGRSAGWINLGLVSLPDSAHFMSERTARLPAGVEVARPVLMSVTPSIMALVIAFQMNNESAAALDEPLRASYTTRIDRDPLFRRRHVVPYVLWNRPARFGQLYNTPYFQRRDAVQHQLSSMEARCTSWVRENLPGVFASGVRGGLFPTAMLMITENERPLTGEQPPGRAFDGLGIDRDYDAWQTDEWPGARMVLPRSWDKGELRLVFACRRRDAFPDEPGYPEPESNWTISQRAHNQIQGLLTRWALTCMLDGYHQLLSSHRDRSAGEGSYRPVRDLQSLRSLVRTDVYDILCATAEVTKFAEDKVSYSYNVLEMQYVREVKSKKIQLVDELRSSQNQRSRQLEVEAGLLLSTLSTSTEVTQTISNIRIQRIVIALTIISIVIAVIATAIALNAG